MLRTDPELRDRWRTLNPEGQAALEAHYRRLRSRARSATTFARHARPVPRDRLRRHRVQQAARFSSPIDVDGTLELLAVGDLAEVGSDVRADRSLRRRRPPSAPRDSPGEGAGTARRRRRPEPRCAGARGGGHREGRRLLRRRSGAEGDRAAADRRRADGVADRAVPVVAAVAEARGLPGSASRPRI